MTTQLEVAAVMNMDAVNVLASEFRERFGASAELIHGRLVGRRFVFNRDGKETYPFDDWEGGSEGEAVPIVPSAEAVTVASTDSSCILLGETSDGAVYAVRAAVCFSARGAARGYLRIGPIIVHLSPSGAVGLPARLEGYELRIALSDHLIAERIIRNGVEKRVLASLLSFPERMVVLADGSLKHPLDSYPETLFRAEGTTPSSALVGISKSSAMISANRLSALISRAPVPAYSMVEEGLIHTLLAKFSRDGLVFRLDVARGRVAETLGRVIANDAFCAGYPESLRIAHHLSVFTRSEDMALKAYITNRYSLKHLMSFGLRRIALGGLSNSG
ncbi:MAG: hypothetical protein ABSF83_06845 [Nitrososphaerales archaeon]